MAERNPERTRARLVEAAGAVVASHGFPGASVGLIAGEAGVSTGAIYAHFAGKDAVLFAVFQEHMRWFDALIDDVANAPDVSAAIARWVGGLTREPGQFLIFVEFWSYAVRRPELKRELAAHMERMRERTRETIERRAAERGGAGPGLPPALTAQLLLAIGRGLAFEKITDPRAVDDDAIGGVFAALLGEAGG